MLLLFQNLHHYHHYLFRRWNTLAWRSPWPLSPTLRLFSSAPPRFVPRTPSPKLIFQQGIQIFWVSVAKKARFCQYSTSEYPWIYTPCLSICVCIHILWESICNRVKCLYSYYLGEYLYWRLYSYSLPEYLYLYSCYLPVYLYSLPEYFYLYSCYLPVHLYSLPECLHLHSLPEYFYLYSLPEYLYFILWQSICICILCNSICILFFARVLVFVLFARVCRSCVRSASLPAPVWSSSTSSQSPILLPVLSWMSGEGNII